MDIQIGILLGIIAMVCWGTADIFAKRVIGKIGVYKTVLTNMSLGIAMLVVVSVFFTDIFYLPPDPLLISTAAFLNILGFIFYYKAFQKGKLSIAAPIGNSHSMITVLLAIILLNEVLTKFQFLSIVTIIVGIILISVQFSELKRLKSAEGSGYAFLSMVLWGFTLFFIAIITRSFDFILTVLWFRILGAIFISLFCVFKKEKLFFPVGNLWIPIILTAFFESMGFLAYASGILTNMVSLITPIASAAPAVTLLLARIFYKERLEFNQKIAALLILIGIIALNL